MPKIGAIRCFLSGKSCWAQNRPREQTERAIKIPCLISLCQMGLITEFGVKPAEVKKTE
jgi:hypothetical protein